MKHILITTIAAMLLVGCGTEPDYSGNYSSTMRLFGTVDLELKSDGSLNGKSSKNEGDDLVGNWKAEGDLLICEGTTEATTMKLVIKFNKTSLKVFSITGNNEDMLLANVPEGKDSIYFKKN